MGWMELLDMNSREDRSRKSSGKASLCSCGGTATDGTAGFKKSLQFSPFIPPGLVFIGCP